jgi:hypothetical protein
MNRKVKITLEDITYGPLDPDDVAAFATAGELMLKGYRKTSNAYCMIARIDRSDWLEVMARKRNCSVADFYSDRHRDHYIRSFSEDSYTVHPKVMAFMKAY